MGKEQRILIYFDELVMSLTKAYGSTMDTHIYSPRDILSCMQGIRPVDAVEVVHGRWIHDCVEGCNPFVDSLPIWVDVMQCSVCKEYIEGSHGTNYCPNCGADMRERKDNVY